MNSLHEMHGAGLRSMAVKMGLDVSNCRGKEQYIKLIQEANMKENSPQSQVNLITEITPEILKSVGISESSLRLSKLRSELDSIRVKIRYPRGSREMPEGGLIENYFGKKSAYSIDENDNTIHFLGGCLGAICTTLSQPDKIILNIARNYLSTFTWDARYAKHAAGSLM